MAAINDTHGHAVGDRVLVTTEVYQQPAAGWRIIHTHWAFRQPKLAS